MPIAVWGFESAISLRDGRVLFYGFQEAPRVRGKPYGLVYDGASDSWKQTGETSITNTQGYVRGDRDQRPLPEERISIGLVELPDGRILASGGWSAIQGTYDRGSRGRKYSTP